MTNLAYRAAAAAALLAAAHAFSAPATAADMGARPMPVKAVPVSPAWNWSGFYAGLHGGYATDPAQGSFDPIAYTNAVAPGVTGGGTVLSGPGSIPLSVDPSGGFGGIQLGHNWQNGPFLFGWEADVSFGRIKDTDDKAFRVTTVVGDVFEFNGNVRLEQEVDYFGTARLRFGWANGPILLFGTGGLAWGNVKTTFEVHNLVVTANGAITAAQAAAFAAGARAVEDDIRVGFAVGGGFEWMLTQMWSLRGEYLFIDLGNGSTLTIPGGTATSDFYMHLGRVALNYRFMP